MKLMIAIVQDEDVDGLAEALIASGQRFTKVSTTGSFLRTGNTSLMIGLEEEQVEPVMALLARSAAGDPDCRPYSPALEPGLLYMPENFEVEVAARSSSWPTWPGSSGSNSRKEPLLTTFADRVDADAVIQTARDLIRIPSVTGDELAVMEHVHDGRVSAASPHRHRPGRLSPECDPLPRRPGDGPTLAFKATSTPCPSPTRMPGGPAHTTRSERGRHATLRPRRVRHEVVDRVMMSSWLSSRTHRFAAASRPTSSPTRRRAPTSAPSPSSTPSRPEP
jgi:uncharacterized protein YaaQ